MNSFTIVDFILFLGISQGVFLAIAIQVIQDKNRLANRILSLILLISSIMLTGRFFFSVESYWRSFFRIALFVDVLIFVFGPLLYLYYRRLIFNEQKIYKLHFINFIPAVLMLCYHFWTYQFSLDELLQMSYQGKLTNAFLTIETVGIIFNFYFCFRCYQLIQIYRKEAKNNLSYSQNLVPFLVSTLITVMLFMSLWVISYFFAYILEKPSYYISYNVIWIAVPLFVYIIGFYSFKQPAIFRVPITIKTPYKERISGEHLQKLKRDLERLMVDEKIYLNHTLTLEELAGQLNTSKNNLSWLLNNVEKCNFYDYINKYRVNAFIDKIRKGEHQKHTLLALSLDSGFNSKSTFNKAFKAQTNETPSNYVKKLNAID